MKRFIDILTAVIVSGVVAAAIPCLSGCGGGGDDDDDGVAALIKQLGSADADTHLRAAWALAKKKALALAPLAVALRSDSRALAERAGEVLAAIGQPAVDVLTKALKDKEFPWPHVAAAALVHIDPTARAAIDTLLATLKDGDGRARAMAADALGRVKLEAATVMAALLNALRDSDDNVCKTAAGSLGKIGAAAIEPMIAALSDSRVSRPRHIALVLARFGPASRKATDAVLAMLKKGDADGRAVAIYTLTRIEAEPAAVIGPLIGALSDVKDEISETAATTLGQIGDPAIGALIEALGDKKVRRPGHAALALAMIGPSARGATDRLLALLKTGDENARGLAAYALSKVAEGKAEVISALVGVLKNDPSPYRVQMYAAEALGRIAPPARAAIPALTEALTHTNEQVRKAAAEALKNIESPIPKSNPAPDDEDHGDHKGHKH